MTPRLTDEERIARNRNRCRRYYDAHQNEGRKRRALTQIRTKGYFPRVMTGISLLEVVDAFSQYQSVHTPSKFAVSKFRNLLASH